MKNIVKGEYVGNRYYLIEETDTDCVLWVENEYDGYSDMVTRGSYDKCRNTLNDLWVQHREATIF